jgi:hypothetical protein
MNVTSLLVLSIVVSACAPHSQGLTTDARADDAPLFNYPTINEWACNYVVKYGNRVQLKGFKQHDVWGCYDLCSYLKKQKYGSHGDLKPYPKSTIKEGQNLANACAIVYDGAEY